MKSQKAWTKKWLRLRQHHETQIQCSTAVSNVCVGGFSVQESWTKCEFPQRSWYLHSSYQQSVSLHHPAGDTSREKGYEAARPPTASDLPLSGKSELGGADERFLRHISLPARLLKTLCVGKTLPARGHCLCWSADGKTQAWQDGCGQRGHWEIPGTLQRLCPRFDIPALNMFDQSVPWKWFPTANLSECG